MYAQQSDVVSRFIFMCYLRIFFVYLLLYIENIQLYSICTVLVSYY